MKLLIIGHSYVKSLSKLNVKNFSVGEHTVEVKYLYKSGASYSTILDKSSYLDQAEEYNPDFVLVVLAGNSLSNSCPNKKIYEQIREFYLVLRARLPNSIIISAQVELRYYAENNRWNCPTESEFRKRRSSVNKFLNRLKLKNYVLNISGPGTQISGSGPENSVPGTRNSDPGTRNSDPGTRNSGPGPEILVRD